MENVQDMFVHAEELKQLARPEDALLEYGELIDANLGGVDSLIRRAFLFQDLGRFREAQLDFELAAELEPWNGWPLLRLAQMWRAMDKPWFAAASVGRAVDRCPEMAEIRINASVIFASLDWLDLAFGVVRPLPGDMGDWWGDVRRSAEADYRRRRSEAIAMIRRLDGRARVGPAMRDVATALLSLGRTRVARQICETALREGPTSVLDFVLYAKVIARERGLEAAVDTLRAVAFLYNNDPHHQEALNLMQEQLGI